MVFVYTFDDIEADAIVYFMNIYIYIYIYTHMKCNRSIFIMLSDQRSEHSDNGMSGVGRHVRPH